MPAAAAATLDSRDLALLRLLDSDARASLAELGCAVRLSKSAVAQRITRLEKEGFIDGYYAVIDSSRLGYLSFRVYLKFYKTSPRRESEIIDFLLGDERVWWLGRIEGEWDAGFVVWVRDLYDFRNFWLKFLSKFRPGIGRHVISPYVKLAHFSGGREAGVVGEGPKIAIDETDRKVLRAVSANARDGVTALAAKTGLRPAVVKYRLKQLVRKGVVQRFRAKINSAKLGLSLYKVEFYLDDWSKLAELRAFAGGFPSLVYVDETIGGGDFEAEFNLASQQELRALVAQFKKRFSFSIREITYVVYSEVLKYSYFPS